MQTVPEKRWDWPSAATLSLALLTAAYRLTLTNWIPDLDHVFNTTLIGCLVGLALGYSRFGRKLVLVLAAGYTAVVIPWQLSLVVETESDALLQLGNIGGRLLFAAGQIVTRQPVQDPLFFLAFMVVTFWVLALHSTFFFVRKSNVLVSILPAAFGIVAIQYYDSYYSTRLAAVGFFLFFCLIILARTNLLDQHAAWRRQRVFMSPEATFDLTNAALVTAAVIVLAAWVLPGIGSPVDLAREAWQRATTPFNGIRDRISDALASLRGSGGGVLPQFGSELNLGRSVSTSSDIQFTVSAADLTVPRFYWRGRIYDSYTGGKWTNAREAYRAFTPFDEQDLSIPNNANRSPGRFIVTMQQDRSALVAPAEPRWFSRSAQLVYAPVDGQALDLLAANPTELVRGGESYEVRAGIINPAIADLRAAGTDYPDWVRERYLQLPPNFSPRIAALAREITAGWDTPYDKAFFITDYLRSNITYADTVEPPPPGVDPLEWFLFETRSGFCNYYASSEVLMLRAVGVPARLVVGYAEGDEIQRNLFAVRARDFHAWPEVYFPNIGWVEFEPTGNQPILVRPVGDVSINPGAGPQPGELPQLDSDLVEPDVPNPDRADQFEPDLAGAAAARDTRRLLALWGIALALGAAFGLYLSWLSRRQPLMVRIPRIIQRAYERSNLPVPPWVNTWLRWMELTPIERAFQSINRALRLLGSPQPISATPAERVAALLKLLPEAAPEIRSLAAEHEASLFTATPGDEKRAWQLQWRIYLLSLNRRYNPPQEIPTP